MSNSDPLSNEPRSSKSPHHGHHHHDFRVNPKLPTPKRTTEIRDWLERKNYFVAIGAVAIVVLGLLFLGLWVLPSILIPSAHGLSYSQRVTDENSVRATLVQSIGGIAIVVGLYYTARSFVSSRDQQVTSRFSTAIAQLGDSSCDVRVGAIAALERIARDSPSDYDRTIEILEMFVRSHAKLDGRELEMNHDELPDVQAAITVIARRTPHRSERQRLQLHHLDLGYIDFYGGRLAHADFSYSMLDNTTFSGCVLRDSHFGDCSLTGASFSGADCQNAAFMDADLGDSWLINCDFTDANFTRANLSGADFSYRLAGRRVRLHASILTHALLKDANTERTNFCGVDLSHVRGLTQDQVDRAITDSNTRFPVGITAIDRATKPPGDDAGSTAKKGR
jgi:uncharacterized protein YjbI with pentapeptide repeats